MWPDEKFGKTESGCSYHSYKVDLFRIFFKKIVDGTIKCGKMIIVR